MKIMTLAAAAALTLSSTIAFAQSTNTPGASNIGGEPNPNVRSGSTSGGTTMQNGSGMTTGSSTMPSTNDASKSGSPAADNAEKPRNAPTPDRTNR